MSRLGKLPIKLPSGTQAKLESGFIIVTGKQGELRQKLHDNVVIAINEGEVKVDVKDKNDKKQRAILGLFSRLLANMVKGVNDLWEEKLEVVGVGYRVSSSGNKLNITIGYSHPVIFELPAGITAAVEGQFIALKGIDKQLVGETAARIRRIRKPDPYKAKGIKYTDEVIRRKEGKTAVKGS